MKIFKKNILERKQPSLESFIDKKLFAYITIVNQGHANAITKIMEKCGSSAQFIEHGEGTAVKEIRNILGIEDTEKEITISLIAQDNIPEAMRYLDVYFSSNKKIGGIGFSVPFNSIIGVKAYQFLADTIKEEKDA